MTTLTRHQAGFIYKMRNDVLPEDEIVELQMLILKARFVKFGVEFQ